MQMELRALEKLLGWRWEKQRMLGTLFNGWTYILGKVCCWRDPFPESAPLPAF